MGLVEARYPADSKSAAYTNFATAALMEAASVVNPPTEKTLAAFLLH
jgi:hypothetical protein